MHNVDVQRLVKVPAVATSVAPMRMEWEVSPADRLPSRSVRNCRCIEALRSTGYGRWRVARVAVPFPRHSRPGSSFNSLFTMENALRRFRVYACMTDYPHVDLFARSEDEAKSIAAGIAGEDFTPSDFFDGDWEIDTVVEVPDGAYFDPLDEEYLDTL